MSKFEPGQEKINNSGRKKGTLNKNSKHLADVLESIGFNIPEKLVEILPQLTIEKQADVLINLMSYIYPKRKAVEQMNLNVDAGSINFDGIATEQLKNIRDNANEKLYGHMTSDERSKEINRLLKIREECASSTTVRIVPKYKNS